jgi:hypothetical protein
VRSIGLLREFESDVDTAPRCHVPVNPRRVVYGGIAPFHIATRLRSPNLWLIFGRCPSFAHQSNSHAARGDSAPRHLAKERRGPSRGWPSIGAREGSKSMESLLNRIRRNARSSKAETQ